MTAHTLTQTHTQTHKYECALIPDCDTNQGGVEQRLSQLAEKGQVWFTDRACNRQGTGAGICKYQSKLQWQISLA